MVAPGADPGSISVGIEAKKLSFDPQGNIVLSVNDREIR
jgi:hypothetical protein